jgi:ribosomal protein L11 methyltransferase
MSYIKVTFELSPDNQDFREILIANLVGIGFDSFTENVSNIDAFIQSAEFSATEIDGITFSPMFEFTYSFEDMPDKNWNEEWEKNYFKPLLIADKCLVRAPFHTDYPKSVYEIVIEPNMAFGTGNHETTSMMIEHLLHSDLNGKSVLDMGAGTGILSIMASMRGAKTIKAIDIDKWAYDSLVENCRLNQCQNIEIEIGDVSAIGINKFDVILANIHKNVLLEDMNAYSNALNEGGILIMSGFYEHDLTDITNKAITLNYIKLEDKSKNKWIAASYQKVASK